MAVFHRFSKKLSLDTDEGLQQGRKQHQNFVTKEACTILVEVKGHKIKSNKTQNKLDQKDFLRNFLN